MSNIDSAEALNQVRASLAISGGYTASTSPIMGRLMTTNGNTNGVGNGTEVTNSGGSTYAPVNVTTALPSNPTSLPVVSSGAITWTNLPTATIVGLELWDSNGTPKRKWFGPLAASKSVTLGDSLSIAAGALSLLTG